MKKRKKKLKKKPTYSDMLRESLDALVNMKCETCRKNPVATHPLRPDCYLCIAKKYGLLRDLMKTGRITFNARPSSTSPTAPGTDGKARALEE